MSNGSQFTEYFCSGDKLDDQGAFTMKLDCSILLGDSDISGSDYLCKSNALGDVNCSVYNDPVSAPVQPSVISSLLVGQPLPNLVNSAVVGVKKFNYRR